MRYFISGLNVGIHASLENILTRPEAATASCLISVHTAQNVFARFVQHHACCLLYMLALALHTSHGALLYPPRPAGLCWRQHDFHIPHHPATNHPPLQSLMAKSPIPAD